MANNNIGMRSESLWRAGEESVKAKESAACAGSGKMARKSGGQPARKARRRITAAAAQNRLQAKAE